jgi:2-keto-4-pentenoate hydratase/2-oxohepta-3-ene-1,7-dioic acid hydratase in catechol pathway/regulator of RNase E activity RraA
VAVHVSYRSRAMERGSLPLWPSYFLKPPSTLAADGSPVRRPPWCELLAFEGEIALVIGTRATRVSPADAWSHVRWVTAANDFGVYDLRYADRGSNLRSKGIDGFTPVGPVLLDARGIDPERVTLRTWVNGELAQDAVSGDDLLFSFADIVSDLSRLTTLEPGDVILTGTPTGSTVVQPGDLVEVEVTAATRDGRDGRDGREGGLDGGVLSTGRLRSPIAEADYELSPPGAMPNADDAQREAAYGSRGAPGPSDSPAELLSAVSKVSTATLASQLRKRGFNHLTLDRLLTTRPSQKMAGYARTLRYVPFREDLFAQYGTTVGGGLNAQKRAVEQVRPGEILVIEARGDPTAGTVGDILALRAQVRGATGIVTDGAIRDAETLRNSLAIPVYYAATHPAVLGRRHVPWEVNATIACAGVTVRPGDIIVGDGDGVIVVPAHLAREVARDAAEQELQEEFAARMVAKGESVDGLYPLGKRWQAGYEAWLAARDAAEDEAKAGRESAP